MTTTTRDQHNDMYDGPAVELFETVTTTTRLMDEARVKQAEAVAALISAHVAPLDDFTDGLHAVFTSNPGTGPLVTSGKASSNKNPATGSDAHAHSRFDSTSHSDTAAASGSSSAFGPGTASRAGARVVSADGPPASVGVDDVVACVVLPSGEVCTVASVERVPEELPAPTEGVLAKVLDCTRAQVVTQVRKIMTAVVLMPKLWSLAKQGVIGFDRVLYTVGRVGRAGVCIPVFDEMLTSKRVDVAWKTFRRHVAEVLAMLTTPETRAANAKRHRSVSYWVNDDGTATLSLTGPVLEMEAFYQRVRGMARAIMSNHIEPFTATLSAKDHAVFFTEDNGEVSEVRVGDLGRVEVDDDRLMDQLTLDVITGAKPSTTLRVRVTRTGKRTPIKVTSVPVDAEHAGAGSGPGSGAGVDASGAGDAGDGSVWADRCEARQAEDMYELELCVSMPEKEEWLKSQASINLTVPVLHFLMNNPPPVAERRPSGNEEDEPEKRRPEYQGSSAPPGAGIPPGASEPVGVSSEFDFGVPVRVDPGARAPVMMDNRVPLDPKTADEVIAQAKWVYRMFTDPQTGVVLESAPTKYYIPAALKRMVEARHPDCSVPWCAVPARVCEKDHIEPFNHKDPENGGLTVVENLHPLCKRHHQLKTQKRLRVDRMDDGSLACVFPRIGAMLVYLPESRINQYQYERLIEYFDTGDQDISDTINQYQPTEPPATYGAQRADADSPAPSVANHTESGTVHEYPCEVYPHEIADEYAIAGEVFNGDTRPWEPSNEPPPF